MQLYIFYWSEPKLTPEHSKGSCSFVHSNLHVYWKTEKRKILNCMLMGKPRMPIYSSFLRKFSFDFLAPFSSVWSHPPFWKDITVVFMLWYCSALWWQNRQVTSFLSTDFYTVLLTADYYSMSFFTVFIFSINKWSAQAWTGSLCTSKPEAKVFHSISIPSGLLQQCSWRNILDIVVWGRRIHKSALPQETLGLRICPLPYNTSGVPSSVLGIATGYGLDGPGIESRWGARFSAPVQTGPGAHPASCTMGTGSFSGVKNGRGVTLTLHPLLVPWSRKGRAYISTPSMGRTACTEPQCLYKGALYFTFTYKLGNGWLFH